MKEFERTTEFRGGGNRKEQINKEQTEIPTGPQGTERMSKIKLEVLIMLLARRNNNSDWLSNIFDDVFFDTDATPRMNATASATNIKETDKDYIMEVAAPGLKKEWVRVNIDNDGNLNIAIENKMEHKNEDKHEHYLRREFSYSNYQQAYTLPEDADREKISAKVADGVLEVQIPKLTPKEETKATKNIEVK